VFVPRGASACGAVATVSVSHSLPATNCTARFLIDESPLYFPAED
jgi:hypothetical protein